MFEREKRQRLFECGERKSACQDTASPFNSGLYEVEAAARADERARVLAELNKWICCNHYHEDDLLAKLDEMASNSLQTLRWYPSQYW